ncbi:hypothetical protein DVH24_031000 [Malus domestica]|uniref:Serine aminopeptidase S33 domain-containing protein n=1 Tax=Malus domestica TaxID=3750 RepID=A0A498HH50_MALDO|nr:hypothetical protein DVH24_031000 [Malus domestica]
MRNSNVSELRAVSFCFRITKRRKSTEAAAMAPKKRQLPGVDEKLRKLLDANMDEAPARRRAREAFKEIQLGIDHILFKTPTDGLKMEEMRLRDRGYGRRGRGRPRKTLEETLRKDLEYLDLTEDMTQNRAQWRELQGIENILQELASSDISSQSNKYLLTKFLCLTCFFVEPNHFMISAGIARKLASNGYGVFAMDYPGFGLSEGLHGHIPSFDRLVDDVIEHYSKVKEQPELRGLPTFLFGQSLGGAVALKAHLKQPSAWNGAILVAPMCKISEDMVPPWILTQILIGVAKFLPKKKLVPQKNLAEAAFKDLKKREMTAYNVISYKDKPRLQTALEMLRTTEEIERRLEEVSLPLLILHGEADIVTDPSVSKALYEKASSSDKKLILYMDAWHSLLEGESDAMINRVFSDILSWLSEHSEN